MVPLKWGVGSWGVRGFGVSEEYVEVWEVLYGKEGPHMGPYLLIKIVCVPSILCGKV